MAVDVVILQGAEQDLLAAFVRYERTGSEVAFHTAIERKLSQLSEFPELGGVYLRDFRRILVDGFPFGIFYRCHGDRLFVVAVEDLRGDPKRIRKRLGALGHRKMQSPAR